ncbi:uncharacterized protein LOC108632930 [Ceratina calcarata]|uniref:Uncharacterized protein LOC108632930 n=1 Tax=Ceratina calcarata TaxID=156304 RepID=A0AAJ7JI48_9HYME|nr:uncharacterized protein LOC108632930 [Ceratina calcarata]
MVLNLKQVTTYCRCPLFNTTVRSYGVYDPPYLKKKETTIKVYPLLNVQIRGYKYPLLENYQSFIYKIAKILNVTVEDSFAFPHREFKINRYKKGSSLTDAEYNLKIYERDVQISNVTSIKCPIFVRILEAALPEGVSLTIDKYDPLIQKKRIIPNKELVDLKAALSELLQNRGK